LWPEPEPNNLIRKRKRTFVFVAVSARNMSSKAPRQPSSRESLGTPSRTRHRHRETSTTKHRAQPQRHQTATIASSHSFDSKRMELNESDDESRLEDALLDHGESRTDLSEVELNDSDLSGTTTPSDDSNGEEPDRARAATRVSPQRPPGPTPRPYRQMSGRAQAQGDCRGQQRRS
jgi:hypothetical protein